MRLNNETDINHLLNQLLTEGLPETEKKVLLDYINNSFDDHALDIFMRKHWAELENEHITMNDEQLLHIKKLINSRIDREKTSPGKEQRLISSSWINRLMRVAAILFIPVLLCSIVIYLQMDKRLSQVNAPAAMHEVVANPGSRVHFYLPDDTEVWLNSESKLEYAGNFKQQDQRIVKLSGQGYFKVAHDAKHPFIVETQGLKIQALGTAFDVSDYSDDEQILATLEEGSIALINTHGKEITRLQPGQKAAFNKINNELNVQQVETILTTSWKDGKLIFRNTSLAEVTRQLERWFNCNIQVDPELLESGLYYTATIQDETLIEVLTMIEISTSVKTIIKGREVHISP